MCIYLNLMIFTKIIRGFIRALQALIHHYAQSGELRRFVIKCRVDNPQSNQVALRNGFILEGCLKQAEFLNDAYDDVNLYARIIDSQ
ncbi:hypothetical protein MUTS6_26870 [Escherichia coli]|nr:hypothetical protein MUTS6_26870 [Escherichia coli]